MHVPSAHCQSPVAQPPVEQSGSQVQELSQLPVTLQVQEVEPQLSS